MVCPNYGRNFMLSTGRAQFLEYESLTTPLVQKLERYGQTDTQTDATGNTTMPHWRRENKTLEDRTK